MHYLNTIAGLLIGGALVAAGIALTRRLIAGRSEEGTIDPTLTLLAAGATLSGIGLIFDTVVPLLVSLMAIGMQQSILQIATIIRETRA